MVLELRTDFMQGINRLRREHPLSCRTIGKPVVSEVLIVK